MLGIPMPCMPINPASCCVMLLPIPPNMLKGLPPFSSAGDKLIIMVLENRSTLI